jgi:hypothetical protein
LVGKSTPARSDADDGPEDTESNPKKLHRAFDFLKKPTLRESQIRGRRCSSRAKAERGVFLPGEAQFVEPGDPESPHRFSLLPDDMVD